MLAAYFLPPSKKLDKRALQVVYCILTFNVVELVYFFKIPEKGGTCMKGIPVTLEIAAVTDIGRRRASNEDNFFVNGAFIDHYKVKAERFESVDTEEVHVLAVCDGMGGLSDGNVAAMIGVTTLSDYADELQTIRTGEDASFTANRIVRTANDRILKKIKKNGKKMGSTFAMLVATVDCLYACNLGDSEIFIKTQFGMERLSKPQTFAQELADSGAIPENQTTRFYGRNQLSKYLGMDNIKALKPNECSAEIRTGDILLICSDGVSDVLASHSIYATLSSDRPVSEIADTLIEKALRKNGGDNMTVVIARVMDDGRMTRLRKMMGIVLGVTAGVVILAVLLFGIL